MCQPNKMNIYMIPASEGDAYHLEFGKEGEKMHHLIIDGGPSSTGSTIKDIMEKIMNDGEIMDLMITHIDYDHICGITKALQLLEKEKGLRRLKKSVRNIYFNTCLAYQKQLKEEQNKKEQTDENSETQIDEPESVVPFPTPAEELAEVPLENGQLSVDNAITLSYLLKDENLGLYDKLKYFTMGDKEEINGATLYFISPGKDQMEALNTEFINEINNNDKYVDLRGGELSSENLPPYEYEDLSTFSNKELNPKEKRPSNMSSLAFLMEYGDIRLAFLGDGRADILLTGMKEVQKEHHIPIPYKVDLMKVTHHGSEHSNSEALFEMIPTDRYMISTNGGKAGKHPSKNVLSRMVECHPNHKIYLYLNDNWWEKKRMIHYFSDADNKQYRNPGQEKIVLINTAVDGFKEELWKDKGLMLYGKNK